MMRNREEIVLRFLDDGKPHSGSEIARETNVPNPYAVIWRLWEKGRVLGSPRMFSIRKVNLGGGRGRYSKRNERYYIKQENGEKEKQETITFLSYNKKQGEDVTRTYILTFATIQNSSILNKNNHEDKERVLRLLRSSPFALFTFEIAEKLKIPKERVNSILVSLFKGRMIEKTGYFDPKYGRIIQFDRGFLYYVTNEQYERRRECHNLFTGQRQRIYDIVLRNLKTEKRFTPLWEMFPYKVGTAYDIIESISTVYSDFKKIEIAGKNFFYIDGILNDDETAKQINYWTTYMSQKNSSSFGVGHGSEDFFEIAMRAIIANGLFRIKAWWETRISKGEIKFNITKTSLKDPRKFYEFDRVLHLKLYPFNDDNNERYVFEAILVFESKYRKFLDKRCWDEFIAKLSDSKDFGFLRQEEIDGHITKIPTLKRNVVPIMILSHRGKIIEIVEGEKVEKTSLASYITRHGGLVIFVSQLEKFMSELTGQNCSFRRLFDDYQGEVKDGAVKDFKTYLEKLFGSQLEKKIGKEEKVTRLSCGGAVGTQTELLRGE